MRRHLLIRFPLIWAVPCPSSLDVVTLSFSKYCRGSKDRAIRNLHLSLIYTRADGERESSAVHNTPGVRKAIYHHSEFFSTGCSFQFSVTSLAPLQQAWPGSWEKVWAERGGHKTGEGGWSWALQGCICHRSSLTASFNSICFFRETGRLWCFIGVPNPCHA